jgi:ATP-dependent DNA helicase 2 subunit 2
MVCIPCCYDFGILNCIDTDNIINKNNGGYQHVTEYIPIAQPNYATLAQLDELEPSDIIGDRA